MLPIPPGSNPLHGASFFVDGPRHGLAAGAIAHLLGIDTGTPLGTALPSFSDGDTYEGFVQGTVANRLRGASAKVQREVKLLEKIASEPTPNRFSSSSGGGTPSAIASQVTKIFCHNLDADPNTIPLIVTNFLHGTLGTCPSRGQIDGYEPLLHQRIDAMVNAVGNRPAVWLLETDALGLSGCIAKHGGLSAWEAALRYEVDKVGSLPHGVAYVEGGYEDLHTAGYIARALKAIDVRKIRGFWTNDTHHNWTLDEVTRDEQISRLTGGAHYVVNTADNGKGPKRNPHPRTQGTQDTCNPPGRALGPRPTTDTGYRHADAFLWSHTPGISSGSCGGGPPAGTFWLGKALGLAARANGRLGPHSPSQPY
jgi:endoglucanase